MRRGLFCFLFLCYSSLLLQAQQVDVRAKTDKQNIQLGDAIQLDISATYDPQRFIVRFPQVPDSMNGFEIVRREKPDTIFKREINEYHQRYIITHFDSGRWNIPSFTFEIESKTGQASEVKRTDSLWIDVSAPLVDTSKPFKPITDVRGAERPWQDIALEIGAYVLIFLALVMLFYFGWRKYKAWKEAKSKLSEAPILTPYEVALQQLQKIKEEALFEQGELKTYYTQLTDVLRHYLEQQFGIDSLEKTSSEIMHDVKKHKALANVRSSLRQVLESADMVKFAKGTPSAEEHLHYLELTTEVVKESYKKYQNQQTTPA